jgi:hypothetical protein
LLALLRTPADAAARILRELGASEDAVRSAVMQQLPTPATSSSLPDADRSWLDFTEAEALDLASKLASFSDAVTLEVRRHTDDERTFRISCRPLGGEVSARQVAALETDDIRTILEADGSVRVGHRGSTQA